MSEFPQLTYAPMTEMGNCNADVGDPPYAGVFVSEDGDPADLVGLASTDELARLFSASPALYAACQTVVRDLSDELTRLELQGFFNDSMAVRHWTALRADVARVLATVEARA